MVTMTSKPRVQWSRFVQIPWPMLAYKGLTATQKILYAVLYFHCGDRGRAHPTISTLASEIGLGKDATMNALDALESQGFILRARPPKKPGGSGKANEYTMLAHPLLTPFMGSENALHSTNDSGLHSTQIGGLQSTPKEKTNTNTKSKNPKKRCVESTNEEMQESEPKPDSDAALDGASPTLPDGVWKLFRMIHQVENLECPNEQNRAEASRVWSELNTPDQREALKGLQREYTLRNERPDGAIAPIVLLPAAWLINRVWENPELLYPPDENETPF